MSMLSSRISQKALAVAALSEWLKPPAVSTMIPDWVHMLIPKHWPVEGIPLFFKAAALVGTERASVVTAGQVSHEHKATIVAFKICGPAAAKAIALFGHECCMVSKASILRTAIMVGLNLPRVENGVMSCTRCTPFTDLERDTIEKHARSLFPEEFEYGRGK